MNIINIGDLIKLKNDYYDQYGLNSVSTYKVINYDGRNYYVYNNNGQTVQVNPNDVMLVKRFFE